MLEDAAGSPARFSIITQAGHLRERVSSVLQEQLRQLGIAVDIVPLDPRGIFQRWIGGRLRRHLFRAADELDGPALTRTSG